MQGEPNGPQETFDTEITPLHEAGDKRFAKLMTSLNEVQAQGRANNQPAKLLQLH